MLIIFNDNLNDEQLSLIETRINNLTKTGISINNINDFMNDFETIRIIHIGKNDYFELEDLDGLNYDAFEISKKDHSNFKKIIENNVVSSIVSFSDTHIWDKYPQHAMLETYLPNNDKFTFDYLKKCLLENKDYTKHRIKND